MNTSHHSTGMSRYYLGSLFPELDGGALVRFTAMGNVVVQRRFGNFLRLRGADSVWMSTWSRMEEVESESS